MVRIIFTSLFILAFCTFNSFATNNDKNSYSVVEVVTPAKEVYDDGIYRIQFNAFYIVDAQGNKILSSGEVFDRAAKVKLSEGNYKIYYFALNGNLLSMDFQVPKGNFLRVELN